MNNHVGDDATIIPSGGFFAIDQIIKSLQERKVFFDICKQDVLNNRLPKFEKILFIKRGKKIIIFFSQYLECERSMIIL